MKTGLLTFYHIHHYGAALQAAATQRALENLGAECELIDYYVNQDNSLFRPLTGLSAAAANAHTLLHHKALQTRFQRFEAFASARFRLTPRRYERLEDLREAHFSYDVLLSGSDQIWNPLIFPDRRFDPAFFGAFFPGRKIAYAPSFGLPRLPEGMEGELREFLRGFSHLSVREASGQEILRRSAGIDAPVVLDPVLLLSPEEWTRWAAVPSALSAAAPRLPAPEKQRAGYLLCYCISDPAALEPYIRRVAEQTGLPIVQLCGVRRKVHPNAVRVLDAGPAEFLYLFRNASFVLTNSFHGTAFSVLFQKPFFTTVSPAERAEPEQSRVYALLHPLGLAERIAGSGVTAEPDAPIDWAAVSGTLSGMREQSLAYLQAALYGEQPTVEQNPPIQQKPPVQRKDDSAHTDDVKSKSFPPKLASHETCTGCTACAAVCPKDAIAMRRDREGFAFPHVRSDLCVRCGRCTAVCPALRARPPRQKEDPPAVFAAWNPEPAVRRDSSSGGVFSALADYVLEEGGVVFGAALDGQQRVLHSAVFRKEELWRLRGAKYVQSDLEDTFRMVRRTLERQTVLFSGTPCQVDGLYHFLGGRPANLITCDLVCHGVPSPGVWEDLLASWREERSVELRSVRFRDKVSGWENGHLTIAYENGAVDSRPLYETEYGHAFGRALFLRRCCYRCPYANLNRPGDFTLGDFWGLDALAEQRRWGISLLLVNTAHASHIFDSLSLRRKPFPVEAALRGNPRLCSPTPRPAERDAFFSAYALDPFAQVRRKFLELPPLPVRLAGKYIPPEWKAAIRKKQGGEKK